MRVRLLVLTIGLAALGAVGCSSDSGTATNAGTAAPTTTAGTTGGTTPPGTSGTTMGTTAPATGATKVALADSALGPILVDGQGMTLYVFLKDTATTSACTGGCIQAWPALAGSSVEPGTGLEADDFTSITGAEGTPQVAFYGHPLYTYAGDNGPGETNGQAFGDNWFVVDAEGNPVKTAP
jgi:predicted lipoprotein with Yx(FWY)xxD motif